MTDDFELLGRWRDGHKDAGDELLRRHFASLYLFFRNKLPEQAQDLVQRTLLACVEARDRIDDRGSFKAYLFGIARKRLADHLRQHARRGPVDFGVTSIEDLAGSPSHLAAVREEQRWLLEAMRRIPLDLQIVLELHYWEDMKVAEIAEAVDIPEGTVKSRLSRAKAALREQLERASVPASLLEETLTNLEARARAAKGALDE